MKQIRFITLATLIAGCITCANAQITPLFPNGGAKPAGPYTPGILAGDYLYVSGQGCARPDGTKPADFEGQAEQTFKNVETIVREAGLTPEHVVYVHVYLDDMNNYDVMNRVFKKHFPKNAPARAVIGVAKLIGTSIEINAVAIRDRSDKKIVSVPGLKWDEPCAQGVLTKDRFFVSSMRGRDPESGKVPSDGASQVTLALDGMQKVLRAAGLDLKNMVFMNPYLTSNIPMGTMNKIYAQHFEFGNTPARATIQVASLPDGSQIEFTGVAARDPAQRRAVRPKNMPPSPTASPCVFAGDTLYCSAKGGFIPGPNAGIYVERVDQQVRQTIRNLLDNLEEADMGLDSVVSTNVYLDTVDEFQAMNTIYRQYFKGILPARTTVQQVKPVADRAANERGIYPELEQISVIAVRKSGTQRAGR